MAITGVNNYASAYSNAETGLTKQSDKRDYKTAKEYKTYLTDKYACLKPNKNYSVEINSSLLSKASTDEKTSAWLEHNLSLIPKVVDSLDSDGSKILSCNVKIEGYDSITTEVHAVYESDPGTDKIKKRTEDQIKRRKQEKEAIEKQMEKRKEEKTREDEIKESVNTMEGLEEAVLVHSKFDKKI